jgi:hypothetical protein
MRIWKISHASLRSGHAGVIVAPTVSNQDAALLQMRANTGSTSAIRPHLEFFARIDLASTSGQTPHKLKPMALSTLLNEPNFNKAVQTPARPETHGSVDSQLSINLGLPNGFILCTL